MTFNEDYQDRILVCRDCGQTFTFSAGEQEFYASKGLTNVPGRCPSCRSARRGGQASVPRPRSEMYEAICANCGRTTSVPFVPREDRPVYCSDCFQAQRASRSSRRDDSRSYSGSSYNNYGGGNRYSGGNGGRGRDRDRGSRDRRDRRDSRW
jgi:CxxC-x17-CxxC domain-containing protein